MKAASVLFSLMIAVVFLTSCSVFEPREKRVALFDGKTLNGWTLITCEAQVDGGDILLKAGNGLVQTEKKYGNFILEF
ncbi:MAG: family 16 glycoside hydrolase, partial [Acidobacteriota bacterium]